MPLIFVNAFSLHALSGLLTHSLFISCIILNHSQLFYFLAFTSFNVHTVFFNDRAMCYGERAPKNNHHYYYYYKYSLLVLSYWILLRALL